MTHKNVLCVGVTAAAKMSMPTKNLTKKALECALQTWFGNARDRGAGGRKLASNQNTVPEDHPNSEDETENAGEQCE